MKDFTDLDNVVNSLSNGAFLVSGNEKPNVMTVAWGEIGVMWFTPVLIIPVRQSRYTKEFIDKTGVFTLSVPFGNSMDDALKYCGTHSGRDEDKIANAGLTLFPAKHINSHIVEGANMYYECRVLYKSVIDKERLQQEEAECYVTNDMHTVYIAEIISSYSLPLEV